jgi:hypothetical protein
MIHSKTDLPADVISWMESEAASLWPALLDSLSYRRTRWLEPTYQKRPERLPPTDHTFGYIVEATGT